MKKLLSPRELKQLFPLEGIDLLFIQKSREKIQKILLGKDPQKLLVVGPCSIHDELSTLEYAHKFKNLSAKVKNFYFVLRFFIEKPRSSLGWTGFLNDPFLDGSNQIDQGITLSRKLLSTLVQLKIPCGMEFLHPSLAPYFADAISWGVIGSRTSSSQIHRQLASSLPFPVGFKNSQDDALDITLQSIVSAKAPHMFPTIDEEGSLSFSQTQGNPYAHIILRGNRKGPNYDEYTIKELLQGTQDHSLPILVDCAHDNSSKNLEKQKECFLQMSVQKHPFIQGLMLESHLLSGKQTLGSGAMHYGLSITDPCLGWEETESLILSADRTISR